MKYISIILLFFVNISTLKAQIPFVEYQAVPNYQVNAQGNLVPIESGTPLFQYNKTNKQGAFPIIGGYTIMQNGKLKRIKIKVNRTIVNGIEYTYLRGVQTQNPSMWNECNTQAVKIDEYTDNEIVVNNFEWKADNTIYGTIYFNF